LGFRRDPPRQHIQEIFEFGARRPRDRKAIFDLTTTAISEVRGGLRSILIVALRLLLPNRSGIHPNRCAMRFSAIASSRNGYLTKLGLKRDRASRAIEATECGVQPP
jgi:hypothetical protein